MSCVREASPPLPDDQLRHDIKKRRFLQPLRGLRRIFRRKGRPVISSASDGSVDATTAVHSKGQYDTREQTVEATNLEPAKSHSTSQLTDDQIDNSQRRSLQSTLLSVSHDSVFTSEQRSPDSGSESSLCVHTRLGFPHSSVRAELFEAVRRRREQENNVSDDEDLGLPRSPASNSPTTADDIFTKENIVTKSSQSTCSDGSLLSMGSSEIDEESYCQSSRHSSKLSLYEKRTSTGSDSQHNDRSSNSLNGDASSLSHSAAKHKMAVKPKRNHGAPHKKRQLKTSNTLPTTPEVNEEMGSRTVSSSAASATKEKAVADSRRSDEHLPNKIRGTEHPKRHHHHHTSVTQINTNSSPPQSKLSSSRKISLSPTASFNSTKSKSFATPITSSSNNCSSSSPIYDEVALSPDDEKDACGKREDCGGGSGGASFFSRLLLRRSSKKKKNVDEIEPAAMKNDYDDIATGSDEVTTSVFTIKEVTNENVPLVQPQPQPQHQQPQQSQYQHELSPLAYVNGGLTAAALKNYPMFRQRIEPLNMSTPEPHLTRTKISYSSTVPVNMSDESDNRSSNNNSSQHSRNSGIMSDASCVPGRQLDGADSTTPTTTIFDVKRGIVQKSHSFRSNNHCSSNKLPFSCLEDTSPSLPANVGLVRGGDDHEYDAVADDVDVESHFEREEQLENVDSNAYEAINLRVEANNEAALAAAPSAPEYGKVAVLNTLNINVNEQQIESLSSPSADDLVNMAVKQIQMPEAKIPVPAPRTSLLSKISSMNRSSEKYEMQQEKLLHQQQQQHVSDNCINFTVTEIDDGQKSIISISGRPSISSELDADIVASSGCEANVDDDDDDNEKNKDVSKTISATVAIAPDEYDDADDVFEPVSESTRIEDAARIASTTTTVAATTTTTTTTTTNTSVTPSVVLVNLYQTDVVPVEEPIPCSPTQTTPLLPMPTSSVASFQPGERITAVATVSTASKASVASADATKPPIMAVKPGEKVRLRSIGNRQELNVTSPPPPLPSPHSKPTIVCDATAGTMKVNDTVVVMRRKTRELNHLTQPPHNGRDDEPELMKVFARRSLKLKESDEGGVGGDELLVMESSSSSSLSSLRKSRDSDKENEDTNVSPSPPPDDRKRKELSPDPVPAPFTPRLPFAKFQRSISHDVVLTSSNSHNHNSINNNNVAAIEKRQRCKSTPDGTEKGDRRAPSAATVERNSPTSDSDGDVFMADEKMAAAVTPFKRIQQRREEWEKRAQQAMKIHGVK